MENKTIYAIITIPKTPITEDSIERAHVYTRTTSNKETLKKYAKTIAKSKQKWYNTYIMPKEEANKKCREINNKINNFQKSIEQKKLDRMSKNLDNLYIKKIINDEMIKRA